MTTIGCLICISLPALGAVVPSEDPLADSLKSRLIQKGFENVAVILADRQIIVTYENRIYRHEVRGIQEVLRLVLPLAKEARAITLIPQNRKIPLGAITVLVNGCQTLSNGHTSREVFVSAMHLAFDVDSIWRKIQALQANSSSWKFEIVVHPQFKAQFGNYDDPVKSQIHLVPEINTCLWKGMSLSAQLIIPPQNELEEEDNSWRPGLLTLSRTFGCHENVFSLRPWNILPGSATGSTWRSKSILSTANLESWTLVSSFQKPRSERMAVLILPALFFRLNTCQREPCG